MRPSADQSKCNGCGSYFKVCPVKPKVMKIMEIEGKGQKAIIVHDEVCDFGGACVTVCPTGAFQPGKE
jgi:ferredoxin